MFTVFWIWMTISNKSNNWDQYFFSSIGFQNDSRIIIEYDVVMLFISELHIGVVVWCDPIMQDDTKQKINNKTDTKRLQKQIFYIRFKIHQTD
jgi:hypothetical protein